MFCDLPDLIAKFGSVKMVPIFISFQKYASILHSLDVIRGSSAPRYYVYGFLCVDVWPSNFMTC